MVTTKTGRLDSVTLRDAIFAAIHLRVHAARGKDCLSTSVEVPKISLVSGIWGCRTALLVNLALSIFRRALRVLIDDKVTCHKRH